MVAANVAMCLQFLKKKASLSPFASVVQDPEALGWHSKHRRKVWLQTSIPKPDPRSLSEFSWNQRRAADRLISPDLSLSIVKLLGPGGEYIVEAPGAEHEGHLDWPCTIPHPRSQSPLRCYSYHRLLKGTLAAPARALFPI